MLRTYARFFHGFPGQKSCSQFLHVSACTRSPIVATESVSKESLMQLRKRTGYSISKCKQAILKFGDDLTQAESWLHESARKEGWEKISKRANVATTQGLLGMIVTNELASVVEVNCQTDFVSRNETFRSLVARISRGIFYDAAKNYRLENKEITSKWNLPYDRVSEKNLDFGQTLPDLLANSVGQLDEKIDVPGACIMRVSPDITLSGYMHPRSDQNIADGVPTGHFAALVALRFANDAPPEKRAILGMQLCQHIIGMNPTSIGFPPVPEEAKEEPVAPAASDRGDKQNWKDESGQQEEEDQDDRESAMHAAQVTKLSNETTLLRQDFMLEPDMTVHEVLLQNDATIVDFVRLERGAISAVHSKSE